MSQQPMMRLQTPDARARRQAIREQLTTKIENLANQNEKLDHDIQELGLGKFLKRTLEEGLGKLEKTKSTKFDEKKHPRGEDGRFRKAPEAGKPKTPTVSELGMEEEKPKKPCDKIDGQKVCGSKFSLTLKDGTKVSLYEVDKSNLSNDEKRKMLDTLAEIHDLYPRKLNTTKIFLKSAETFRKEGHAPDTGAYTVQSSRINNEANNNISFNFNHPLRNNIRKNEKYTLMPSLNQVGFDKYIINHEIGHQFDVANNRFGKGPDSRWNPAATVSLYSNKAIRRHLSEYGRDSVSEAYAEAFAEWHSTGGKTKNVAAHAYAKHQGWSSYTSPAKVAPSKKKTVSSSGRARPAFTLEEDLMTQFAEQDDDIIFVDGTDPKTAKIIGAPEGIEPTPEEQKRADDIIREVYAELGLPYEE